MPLPRVLPPRSFLRQASLREFTLHPARSGPPIRRGLLFKGDRAAARELVWIVEDEGLVVRSRKEAGLCAGTRLFSQPLQRLAMLLAHIVVSWQMSIIARRCEQQLCVWDHAIQETS